MNRRNVALMDVTGDGCPDFVVSGNNGQIQVSINKVGTTNKLKRVSRPLGANFVVSYHKEGNTYDMPHLKWVLDKVLLSDGYSVDGSDQMQTFRYSSEKYNRLEREFYGFGQVIMEYRNPANSSLLKSVITNYCTSSYYNKGLVSSEEIRDSGGKVRLRYFLPMIPICQR